MKVGVLAIQGDFEAHAQMLAGLGMECIYVKRAGQLSEVDALILPGGESTTHLKFFQDEGFAEAIRRLPKQGRPLFGTCAGAILLAKEVRAPYQQTLDLVDITIERNAYGRQLASVIRHGSCVLKNDPLEMVFIRAPIIRRLGPRVKVLAECDGLPVAVVEGKCLLTTFHPELTSDTTLHRYFLELARETG